MPLSEHVRVEPRSPSTSAIVAHSNGMWPFALGIQSSPPRACHVVRRAVPPRQQATTCRRAERGRCQFVYVSPVSARPSTFGVSTRPPRVPSPRTQVVQHHVENVRCPGRRHRLQVWLPVRSRVPLVGVDRALEPAAHVPALLAFATIREQTRTDWVAMHRPAWMKRSSGARLQASAKPGRAGRRGNGPRSPPSRSGRRH